jgi:hypothetical protein
MYLRERVAAAVDHHCNAESGLGMDSTKAE